MIKHYAQQFRKIMWQEINLRLTAEKPMNKRMHTSLLWRIIPELSFISDRRLSKYASSD